MSRKEARLAKRAARALLKLRARHAPSADEAAVGYIERTARLFGLPQVEAHEAARLMVDAGITPQEAARLFSEALERLQ